jgi:preprotein translocase subunit SecA
MFENLISAIDDEIIHRIFKIAVAQNVQTPVNVSEHAAGSEEIPETSKNSSEQASASGKLGRNDPCWCGSGKKWKKCHYPELPN